MSTFNQKNYLALLERDEIAPKKGLAVAERLIHPRLNRPKDLMPSVVAVGDYRHIGSTYSNYCDGSTP
jgi:hypothetical protein